MAQRHTHSQLPHILPPLSRIQHPNPNTARPNTRHRLPSHKYRRRRKEEWPNAITPINKPTGDCHIRTHSVLAAHHTHHADASNREH